jgi:NAD(P)H-hydrate epimerase
MIKVLSNEQMRAADNYTINVLGVSSQTLMRRAGEAIAARVKSISEQNNLTEILVVCGNGNNGGDGYVCAQTLKNYQMKVKVLSFDGKLSQDGLREKERYTGEYTDKVEGEIIVDCIFGTGLSRNVEGKYKEVIGQINESRAKVVSADIPSGLNGDNGRVMGVAVKADYTVAVAYAKAGCYFGDGLDYCGEITVCDIGITSNDYLAQIYGEEDIKPFFPARRRNSNKGTYGSANLIAGSEKYRGAAVLSCEGALRSGCGYVKLTATDNVKQNLVCAFPQVIYLDEADLTANAIAVGMGCGQSEELYKTIDYILKNYTGKLIIDADGLNVLAKYGVNILDDKKCEVLITPHIKEFSRLTGESVQEILTDPVFKAQRFAREHNIIVLLKNAATVICDGQKAVINISGTSALSKGGSGDMLSGLICGGAARGLNLFDAATAYAYVAGEAANNCSQKYSDYCTTAKEILKELPNVVKRLTSKK